MDLDEDWDKIGFIYFFVDFYFVYDGSLRIVVVILVNFLIKIDKVLKRFWRGEGSLGGDFDGFIEWWWFVILVWV